MRRIFIEDARKIAVDKGGECISEKYINAHSKLVWKCNNGHTWETTYDKIKQGKWCPHCAGNAKHNIDYFRKIAEEKEGKCLSENYINNHTSLMWQCNNNHTWSSVPKIILRGGWCPQCAGTFRANISQMQQIALARGGECLSKEYTNAHSKLTWMCKEKHIWKATPNKIQQGRWCPICSVGISERICSKIFEDLFGKKLDKDKPKWLVNEKGNRMELDGYSKQWGIAFEYQGEQHYKQTRFFHQKRTLEEQKRDDELKLKLCKEHDIILVRIPYKIKFDKLKEFIIKECLSNGIFVPNRNSKKNYNELDIYSPNKIKEMEKLANSRNGKMLSNNYINNSTKLEWQCENNHTWLAAPNNIRNGYWCPYCAGRGKTIEDMEKIAISRGGKCLSPKFVGARTKLIWQCKENHVWEAVPDSISRGRWCPICARNRKRT
ncbi:MAG: hypothetical protein AABX04_04835 [Nanoarchaeota archaeon]